MVSVFRGSAVYVPQEPGGALWCGEHGGVRWILAFTSEEELGAFARVRGFAGSELPYVTVRGDRLLDVAVPAAGVPCGVALDAGGAQPMLFPPVRGIVPDGCAVDAGTDPGTGTETDGVRR
ncbi:MULTISPECIES: SseB family protein [Kitasatospora]|nr:MULTISPECIES: SseB family protein [Kitasatospora]